MKEEFARMKEEFINEYDRRTVLTALRGLQTAAQKTIQTMSGKQFMNAKNESGIWLKIVCICGHDFRTPYNVRDDCKCQKCGHVFFEDRRTKRVKG